MLKTSRQLTIKEIIAEKDITNQEDLRRELRKKGFTVTQATLSRDLRELGVYRASTVSGSKYELHTDKLRSNTKILTGREIVSIDSNEVLIIIITLPGCANAVAQYIDSQKNPDILGTVAGDDTILVIPASVKKNQTIRKYIQKLVVEER